MKVWELINYLANCDQNADVMIDYGGEELEVDGIGEEDGYVLIQ
nr:hypothetical protein [Paenibacillus xylanexedens]